MRIGMGGRTWHWRVSSALQRKFKGPCRIMLEFCCRAFAEILCVLERGRRSEECKGAQSAFIWSIWTLLFRPGPQGYKVGRQNLCLVTNCAWNSAHSSEMSHGKKIYRNVSLPKSRSYGRAFDAKDPSLIEKCFPLTQTFGLSSSLLSMCQLQLRSIIAGRFFLRLIWSCC